LVRDDLAIPRQLTPPASIPQTGGHLSDSARQIARKARALWLIVSNSKKIKLA
jgi:hypothetical protein